MTWQFLFLPKDAQDFALHLPWEYGYLRWFVSSQLADLWPAEPQNRVFPIDLRVKRTLRTKVRRGWDLEVVERNGFQIRVSHEKEVYLSWLNQEVGSDLPLYFQ